MPQLQRVAISADRILDNRIALTPDQARYLFRVLRLHPGDRFVAILDRPDELSTLRLPLAVGESAWWLAELDAPAPQSAADEGNCTARLLEPLAEPASTLPPIALLAGLPKGSGFDDVVRQTTELGVARLVPVMTQRSLLNPSPQRVARWRRIAREAAEQAERASVPAISDPLAFEAAILLRRRFANDGDWSTASRDGAAAPASPRYLCVARRHAPHLLDCLAREAGSLEAVTLAVGPEGGWTEAEIDRAIAAGFQPASLGRNILRSVTAPAAALALVGGFWEAELGKLPRPEAAD